MDESTKKPQSSGSITSTSSEKDDVQTEKLPGGLDGSAELPSDKDEAKPEASESQHMTGVRLYAILFGLTLVAVLVMMDQAILVTAIPHITNQFHSLKDIGWYGSANMLALAAFQPLAGKFYQFHSPKPVFLIALAIFEIGSLICALANSSALFIVGRAIAGAGGSGIIIGMLTIIASAAPLQKRPLYFGFVVGTGSIGLVLGPVLGGLFTEKVSWRWCFYINLPLGAITFLVFSLIRIPDDKTVTTTTNFTQQLKRLDLPGFALFTPACAMLLLALSWGGVTYNWNSATVIGLFCGAAAVTVLFILWENRQGEGAMIPLSLFRNRFVIAAIITTTMSQGSLLVVSYYLPIWFQTVKNATPLMGGVYYLPSVGAQVIGSIVTGASTSRLGYYTPFAILGTAMTSVASGLFSILTPSSNAGMWAGFQILSGFSRGLTMQQPLTAIQAALPKEKLAVGNSFLMFSQVLGGALFVSFAQTIFSNQLRPALEHYAPGVDVDAVIAVGATAFRTVVDVDEVDGVISAYNRALTRCFYLGAGATVVAFVSSWGLGWTNLKSKKAEEAVGNKV